MLFLILVAASLQSTASAEPVRLVTRPACFSQVGSAPVLDKRPAIAELLTTLREHAGQRGEEDVQALALVKKLTAEFKISGPKDRVSIAKGLGKCLGKVRTTGPKNLPDNQLYVPVAKALGKMGPESTQVLIKWTGSKRHRDNLVLQRELIRALGQTKDLAALKTLKGLLSHKSDRVVAWAGEAFGGFAGAPSKVRKDIFEDLLRILTTNKTIRDQRVNSILARKRFDAVDVPFRRTMGALSGQGFRTSEACAKWWKENRKADWDKTK